MSVAMKLKKIFIIVMLILLTINWGSTIVIVYTKSECVSSSYYDMHDVVCMMCICKVKFGLSPYFFPKGFIEGFYVWTESYGSVYSYDYVYTICYWWCVHYVMTMLWMCLCSSKSCATSVSKLERCVMDSL